MTYNSFVCNMWHITIFLLFYTGRCHLTSIFVRLGKTYQYVSNIEILKQMKQTKKQAKFHSSFSLNQHCSSKSLNLIGNKSHAYKSPGSSKENKDNMQFCSEHVIFMHVLHQNSKTDNTRVCEEQDLVTGSCFALSCFCTEQFGRILFISQSYVRSSLQLNIS